jgi:hypothetical protein
LFRTFRKLHERTVEVDQKAVSGGQQVRSDSLRGRIWIRWVRIERPVWYVIHVFRVTRKRRPMTESTTARAEPGRICRKRLSFEEALPKIRGSKNGMGLVVEVPAVRGKWALDMNAEPGLPARK